MITRKHMVRLADDYFRLHWEECEAAARKGMDTPLDVTINEHRMEMFQLCVQIVARVIGEDNPRFDEQRFLVAAGLEER